MIMNFLVGVSLLNNGLRFLGLDNEKYAKFVGLSPKSNTPHCRSVVSDEQGHVTYTITSSKYNVPYGLSLVSNGT